MIWRLALGLLVAAAIVVIGLQIRENSGQPEVGATGPTTVLVPIVGSPVTPLPRDSGPENNAPRKKERPRRNGASQMSRCLGGSCPRRATGNAENSTRPSRQKRRSPARKPPKAHSPPRRPDSSQGGSSGGDRPPSAPPQSKPPPVVTVPSPKVCVNGLVEVGDCG